MRDWLAAKVLVNGSPNPRKTLIEYQRASAAIRMRGKLLLPNGMLVQSHSLLRRSTKAARSCLDDCQGSNLLRTPGQSFLQSNRTWSNWPSLSEISCAFFPFLAKRSASFRIQCAVLTRSDTKLDFKMIVGFNHICVSLVFRSPLRLERVADLSSANRRGAMIARAPIEIRVLDQIWTSTSLRKREAGGRRLGHRRRFNDPVGEPILLPPPGFTRIFVGHTQTE